MLLIYILISNLIDFINILKENKKMSAIHFSADINID